MRTESLAWMLVFAIGGALIIGIALPDTTLSQSMIPITGYAWSDTIGWISFDGSSYGLVVAADGTVSGYAWSETIGWVSANSFDLTGCPSAPCSARISGGRLVGWLRALSGDSAQSGGWDGWISLSGSNYGPALSGGGFSGYAWGDTNIGWIDFQFAQTGFILCPDGVYSCHSDNNLYHCASSTGQVSLYQTCQWGCSVSACLPPPAPTGHLNVVPLLAPTSTTVTVSWSVSQANSCTVRATNGDGSGSNATGAWNTTSGTKTSSPIVQQTTYILHCDGVGGTTLDESVTVNVVPVFQER